ncbi:MAG TPA: dihydrodipicolinate synthase family protein [Gemmatimonadales bacterium]
MTRPRIAGVLAPLCTPFDPATGDVAPGAVTANIARLLADGLSGFLMAGSSGEAPLLDREEQRRLIATARGAIPRDRHLLAGTGAESTRQALALARDAAAEGADAVLVRPPSYFTATAAHSSASLAAHFRAIADGSPVPVLVYNIPKYARIPLAPELLAELASHPNIIGVKDSSGDAANLAAYRRAVPRWTVLVGSASLLRHALGLGCDGGIVGVACFAARACVELAALCARGDAGAAAAQQERVARLDKEIVGALGPAGIKAAMDAVGLVGGPVRPPLAPLAAPARARVDQLVAA